MQVAQYIFLKIPAVLPIILPICVLVATLASIGKLSQLSELTAFRACGVSLFSLTLPLLLVGLLISLLLLLSQETFSSWAQERLHELVYIDIKKKDQEGALDRNQFWQKQGDSFLQVGYYDSRSRELNNLSRLNFDSNFNLLNRVDAEVVRFESPAIGWVMYDTREYFFEHGVIEENHTSIPFLTEDQPSGFQQASRDVDEFDISTLITKISDRKEAGIPTVEYEVELQSRLAYPFLSLLVVFVGVAFGVVNSRTAKFSKQLAIALAVSFLYYIVQASFVALGKAELLPVWLAGWGANIILFLFGLYLYLGLEESR